MKFHHNPSKLGLIWRHRQIFKGYLPASFHGHVGDAINPHTVVSFLLSLAISSSRSKDESLLVVKDGDREAAALVLGLNDLQMRAPFWAVLEIRYGTRYGSLVRLHFLSNCLISKIYAKIIHDPIGICQSNAASQRHRLWARPMHPHDVTAGY